MQEGSLGNALRHHEFGSASIEVPIRAKSVRPAAPVAPPNPPADAVAPMTPNGTLCKPLPAESLTWRNTSICSKRFGASRYWPMIVGVRFHTVALVHILIHLDTDEEISLLARSPDRCRDGFNRGVPVSFRPEPNSVRIRRNV